jgi:hypothetical protein
MIRFKQLSCVAAAVLVLARPAMAQQRPLLTEDPEPIGAGRILVEGGFDYIHDQQYPVSGLEGNMWRAPSIGLSFGISSIAEFQLDGGYNFLKVNTRHTAPFSGLVNLDGDSTSDWEDTVVATKIRVLSEAAGHPAFALRVATKLPNAQNGRGIGLDTTDFHMAVLSAKTVQSVRIVGNVGVAILADPTNGARQNDVLTYSGSFARALTDRAEVVGEVSGRKSTRRGKAFPGTETRSILKIGTRYTTGSMRVDAGMYVGLTPTDPTLGLTAGFTYVFNAFTVP